MERPTQHGGFKRTRARRAVGVFAAPEEVLGLILDLHERAASLRRDEVKRAHPELEHAARTHFGAWRNAVEAAGLAGHVYERWDRARVLAEIGELHRGGTPLAHSRAPSRLVEAAITYFGSWRQAIESAGLDYEAIRLPTRVSATADKPARRPSSSKTPDAILAMLREAATSGRTGVGRAGFISAWQAEQARRSFGSILAAVEAAGLEPVALGLSPHPRFKTDDAIAAKLRALMAEQPNMTLATLHRMKVGKAIKRRHSTLQAGLLSLGISGWPQQRIVALPAPPEIIAGIRDRHRRGEPMDVASVMATDRRLVKAGYKRFGTWRAAMRAAGLGAEINDGDWDRARVRAELQGRRMRGEATTAAAIRRDDPALWSGIVDRFGDLDVALRDIGRARRRAASRRRRKS